MKTWIFVIASGSAAVFFYDPAFGSLRLTKELKRRTKEVTAFFQYLADEMKIACGSGTNAGLVVCGNLKTSRIPR